MTIIIVIVIVAVITILVIRILVCIIRFILIILIVHIIFIIPVAPYMNLCRGGFRPDGTFGRMGPNGRKCPMTMATWEQDGLELPSTSAGST